MNNDNFNMDNIENINKRVEATSSTSFNGKDNEGVLLKITKGRYKYVIAFDNGNTFGVADYILL